MKLNGIIGKGSGKLGSSVFAISGGEQIVREYNPVVANPNTDAQVAQRAKFKLMSQLAADLASVIVMQKDGLVSARNKFVSKNIGIVAVEGETASVNYVALQLTDSNAAFPAVTGSIDGSGVLGVELAEMPAADVQKVVYCVFAKDSTEQLSLIATTIIDRDAATNKFATSFENAGNAYVVYAYGIKQSAIDSNPNYADYVIEGATDIAKLVAARSIKLDASGTTRTSGVLVAADAIRAISALVPAVADEPYEAGSIAGPTEVTANSTIIVNLNKSADEAPVSNAVMKYVANGEQRSVNLEADAADGNKVYLEYTGTTSLGEIYVSEISFNLNGSNTSISFALPN